MTETANLPSRELLVSAESDGNRLDLFLANTMEGFSRGYFQKLITAGDVLVNGQGIVKAGFQVKSGDKVHIIRLPDINPKPTAEQTTLDILYEDEAILVINKPAGLVVHPTPGQEGGTLVNALLGYNDALGKAVYDPESAISQQRPGIVHRLDKDTSGVMIVAKTAEALQHLASQFHEHTVEKTYQTLVYGKVEEPFTVNIPIRRKPGRGTMGVSTDPDEGREAVTHLTPIAYYQSKSSESITLLECRIETGRTHQIRVHCKYKGHAVLGDPLYYSKPSRKISMQLGCTRQMLHAAELVVIHPLTDKKMTFTAPLAKDIQIILTKLQAT